MSEKLCMFCEHFDFEAIGIGQDYSEYTGGDPYGGMTCKKRHYVEERPHDLAGFRRVLMTAKKCKDYLPPSSVAQ